MKRACTWFLALCLTAGILAGCGGGYSGNTAEAPSAVPAPSAPAASAPAGDWAWDSAATESMAPSGEAQVKEAGVQEAKRIYRADLWLETTAFDEAVTSLTALVERCGGWFEYSSQDGSGYRSGNYTIRVPAEQFQPFLNQVGQLCHVTSQSTHTEDVSEAYYDTAGRLKTQQTKLERLQTLLARAETMEDIITIESAISETEQQIEYLSGDLRHYDSLVGYSTISVYLNEVYQFSNVEQPVTSFGERLAAAFSDGLSNFGYFLQDLMLALAYNWMWLALIVVIVAVVVILRRKRPGKRPRFHFRKGGVDETPKSKDE